MLGEASDGDDDDVVADDDAVVVVVVVVVVVDIPPNDPLLDCGPYSSSLSEEVMALAIWFNLSWSRGVVEIIFDANCSNFSLLWTRFGYIPHHSNLNLSLGSIFLALV